MHNKNTQRVQTSSDAEILTESDAGFEFTRMGVFVCIKMLWTHYLVGVSHFAKYSTNRPLFV